MMTTYKAVLHGDTIEWRENVPQQVSLGQAVDVHVTVLDQIPVAENRGQRMAESLSKLAQSGALADVDGQEWEREIREDKALVDLTERQRQELDDRLAAYYRDYNGGSSWAQVKARLQNAKVETDVLSEAALADWNRPEEEEAWSHLQSE